MPDLVSIHARTYKLQRILHNKLIIARLLARHLKSGAETWCINAAAIITTMNRVRALPLSEVQRYCVFECGDTIKMCDRIECVHVLPGTATVILP